MSRKKKPLNLWQGVGSTDIPMQLTAPVVKELPPDDNDWLLQLAEEEREHVLSEAAERRKGYARG